METGTVGGTQPLHWRAGPWWRVEFSCFTGHELLRSGNRVSNFWTALPVECQYTYTSVSQPPGRSPVPGPGINYTGPREALLEIVILVF